ncbi:MFS transporter [Sphingomonas psychrolutea]|uniref:MFS transporter n=1 Tax=Sphingomonas psychrolutea TaxID=1259676 RepID=A0ABQ1G6U2_9SPHN|nr:MFS transporter [Sphingomonas psychrolutea]GGA37854.1 MFS transporter [Sphingomonas psychrolutea]
MTIATVQNAKLGRAAWCWALFQGGRDPYIILVTIYVFVPYLVTSIIADPVHGQELVASGAKYAGWIVALTAPLLGAVVDRMGPRKPWLIATVALMLPLMLALWWAKPGGTGLSVGIIIAILAALGGLFAYTQILHNALLLPAAGARHAGAASGLALAFGNFVSVGMLAFVLWGFALPGKVAWSFVPTAPLFELDVASHQQDRIVPVLAALALALGTLPLLAFVPDVARTGVRFAAAIRLALADLKSLVLEARGHRDGLVYLGATLLFTDGLTGILIFSGVYAAGVMGWQSLELLAYGMILCVFAVGGGLLAGWLDGRIGPKRALTFEICGVVISQLLSLGNTKALLFYQPYDTITQATIWSGPMFRTAPELGLIACGMLGAVTVTAAYASSRTMLTRVVPAHKVGVFFGLFVIAGSATMWLGPLLVQLATAATGSQRAGLLPISGLLVTGLMVLQLVRGENKNCVDAGLVNIKRWGLRRGSPLEP